MTEIIITANLTKDEKYKLLQTQVEALVAGENNWFANITNCIAALHHNMNFFWTGIYFTNENALHLGPFQGTVACTKIGKGKGVCGASYQNKTVIIVDNVDDFEGHIACSSLSKSEIVLPIFDKEKNVIAILDIDSEHLGYFDETDKIYLENIVKIIKNEILIMCNSFTKQN